MNTALTINQFTAIVEKVKRLLLRGSSWINGVRTLSRSLGVVDDFGGTVVAREDFIKGLAECNVTLSKEEIDIVYLKLDRNGSGKIDPTEFIAAMRVGMAPVRHAWLRRVWMSLPKNKEGHATVDTLQQHYRPDRHPDVVLRKRTEDEVINEFISTFNEETNPRGTVSPQEFEQYYTGVSTAYFDDEQFVALLRGVWEIPGVDEGFSMTLTLGQGSVAAKTFHSGQTLAEKKEVTNLRRNQTELLRTIVDKHRPPVIATTASIRRLTSAVRQADLSETTFVSVEAFLEALRQSRLYFDDVENILPLDTNGDRTVDILYYLELLLPQLPPTRLMLVERMWATVFPTKDAKDRVDVLEFQRRFKAKDGEEKSDFLNAWDVRTAVNGKVRLAEVMEWYIPQSAKVVLDKDFEALIARQWPGFKVSD